MHLLSTGALFQLIQHQPMSPGPFRDFMAATARQDLAVSVVSIGQMRHAIAMIPHRKQAFQFKPALTANLDAFIRAARRHNQLVPVDLEIIETWAKLMPLDLKLSSGVALGADTRMVVATALYQHWTLVETAEPYLGHLQNLGLSYVTPF